ncbi:TetR/AcrR family transcriptional regulator [Demequina soli]|uniref:TetR/AcrR family transcriptional regulator n=1 Tax=Demequina soli TaxID=1638987 RepID=UPI000785D887|nr:TetR family transcriptional regulator [Demequina soli]
MSETIAADPVRRRPRDRRQVIEAAAAAAFAERGYHRVAMQDVADAVGISAAALYRHFDTKYDLFREVALGLVGRLADATADVEAMAEPTPEAASEAVEALLDAVAGATIGMRATGGIYRWESRYLRTEDRHALRDAFAGLRGRIVEPEAVLRPEAAADTLDLAALAALSAIASVTTHRTAIPAPALRTLVRDAALRVLARTAGPAPGPVDGAAEPLARPRRRRDQLAHAGIALFAERGYHDVRLEEIAAAVGLTPSGVYRHFGSKAEILLTACQRAAAALDGAAEEALGHADPREALRILEAAYIRFAVDDRDLMDVYSADVGALDEEDQRRLRRLQRAHVDDWVELLGRVRPDLDPREARCLVHAGFNVVADLAVALRRAPAPAVEAWIAPVLEAVLDA